MSPRRTTRRGVAALALWAVAVQVGGLAVAAGALRADEPSIAVAGPAVEPAALPVLPPTTTTTVAPTTVPTTPAPPPTVPPTTAPPAAPAPRPVAPAPAPPSPPTTAPPAPPTTGPQAPTGGLLQQVLAPYDTAVPSVWRNAITVSFEVISGSASYAWPSGRIQISTTHLLGGLPQLRTTLAHEFGHLIAYRYGSQGRAGAPPTGWPYSGAQPNEMWSDCVAQVFTGIADASHGLPLCPAATLAWTATWLAAGPSGHPRTDGGG